MGITAKPAHAQARHAILLHSEPLEGSVLAKSPAVVRLWFSEPVQLVGQAITIFAPSGGQVQHGSVRESSLELSIPVNAQATGTYLVSWQVVSQDTDPVSGRFVFSVGHAGGIWASTVSGGVSPLGVGLQALARFLHFLGYALGFGTLAFLWLVLFPSGLHREETVWRLWRLVNIGILLLLLAEIVAVFAQMVSLGAGSLFTADILGDVLASSFGRVLAQRLGAAILLWVCAGIAQQYPKPGVTAALVLGLLLAFIDGEASHALTSRLPWPALIANALHIVAMGVWVGGLLALLALWRLKAILTQRRVIVKRFGTLAIASLVELICTGIFMAWLLLPGPSKLFTTSYGHVLIIKLVALLLPLLFVFISQRVSLDQRTRWLTLEALGLTGILVLAGFLVALPPFA
jgi:copper transport protein